MSDSFLAYIDESGSAGSTTKGGSLTFTLACLLVPADRWPDVFDSVIGYRRFLRDRFKIPVRAEIKANYLLRNGGPLRELQLSESARQAVYIGMMRLQRKLDLRAFAVVIRKKELEDQKPDLDPREVAWEYLIQRLERFTTKGASRLFVFHDEGEGGVAQKLIRKARRAGTAGSAFGTGPLRVPARLIVEDPVARKSHESYFIQLADLDAYAAFRSLYSPPERKTNVVERETWDELGSARLAEVNSRVGSTPGIVDWPLEKGKAPI